METRIEKHSKMVYEFMDKHGQVPKLDEYNPAIWILRRRLVAEEFAELCIAIHEQNIVEVADSMADLWYVVLGANIAMGIHLKSEGHLPFYDCATELSWPDCNLEVILTLLKLVQTYAFPYAANGLERTLSRLSYIFKIPFDSVFEEVHRSNMSKGVLNSNGKGGKVTKDGSFFPPNILRAASGK